MNDTNVLSVNEEATLQVNTVGSDLLSRGLVIMRMLENGEGMTQLELAKASGFPRTTVKRILDILEEQRVISKDNRRKYQARLGLLPLVRENEFDNRLKLKMRKLAEVTGHTVEWYVPSEKGMILIRRYTPETGETGIIARVGFCRDYDREIDSVNALALAWFHPDTPSATSGYKGYIKPGVLQELPGDIAREWIYEAHREPVVADHTVNTHNVRRVSAAVFSNNKGVGIISLAIIVNPNNEPDMEETLDLVRGYGCELSDNCTHWQK